MFDQPYAWKRGASYKDDAPQSFIRCFVYTFQTEYGPYVVRAEELISGVFAIKFYPKCFRRSKKKYEMLTSFRNAGRVLATCLYIMMDLRTRFPGASFGFKGASLAEEDEFSTKRFRIYRRIFQTFFSPAEFLHLEKPAYSIYLIINQSELRKDPEKLTALQEHLLRTWEFEEKDDSEA